MFTSFSNSFISNTSIHGIHLSKQSFGFLACFKLLFSKIVNRTDNHIEIYFRFAFLLGPEYHGVVSLIYLVLLVINCLLYADAMEMDYLLPAHGKGGKKNF